MLFFSLSEAITWKKRLQGKKRFNTLQLWLQQIIIIIINLVWKSNWNLRSFVRGLQAQRNLLLISFKIIIIIYFYGDRVLRMLLNIIGFTINKYHYFSSIILINKYKYYYFPSMLNISKSSFLYRPSAAAWRWWNATHAIK